MLLNKYFWFSLILILVAVLYSCNEKEKKTPDQTLEINTSEDAVKEARKIIGNDVQVAILGHFNEDSTKEFAAGTEINKPDKWGIQFHLFKKFDDTYKNVDSTDLLAGSFTGAHVSKKKLQSVDYDMIYYNSLDYYIGSGGGEVFSYLIDFNDNQTYYAHLFMERGRSISLFLSENMTPEIKNFFLGVFKKDYPNLKIVSKDADLDN